MSDVRRTEQFAPCEHPHPTVSTLRCVHPSGHIVHWDGDREVWLTTPMSDQDSAIIARRQKPTPFTEMVQVIDELPVILRNARRARGLSLRGVADQSGASFNALSRLERGKECSVSTLRTVLVWLDETTPPAPAVTKEDEPPPPLPKSR